MFYLIVSSIGKVDMPFLVFHNDVRTLAKFTTREDAEMAADVMRMLRTDSAFKGVRVVDHSER